MNGWLEALEAKDREEKLARLKVVSESSQRPRREISRGVAVSASVIALVAVTASVTALAINATDNKTPQHAPTQPAAMVMPTTKPSMPQAKASLVVAGSTCKPQVGQKSPIKGTLQGVVADFEAAYFSRDVEQVIDMFATDSALRDQDWETIFSESIPENTDWCARIEPPEGNQVNMTLEMTPVRGETEVFEQVVSAKKDTTGWKITSVEAKQESQ